MSNKVTESVIDYVCSCYLIDKDTLFAHNKSREMKYVLPRQTIMYLLKYKLRMNDTHIGEVFEKNRTSVISNIKSINNYIRTDKEFRTRMNLITNMANTEIAGLIFQIYMMLMNGCYIDPSIINKYNDKLNESKQGISDVPGDKPVPAPAVS